MCDSYKEILEKDIGLFNKNTIKDIVKEKGSELKHTKNLLEIADSSLKEK